MRRTALLLLVLLSAVLVVPVRGAAAVGTISCNADGIGGAIVIYTCAWTSSAGGAVSANPQAIVRGRLVELTTVPGTAGTQPTDLYDLTLVDEYGVDLLNGRTANLSNATAKIWQWDPPLIHEATNDLDFVIANAGNAKTGTFILRVQQ